MKKLIFNNNRFNIPKLQIAAGIFIGLFFAFTFYLLLCGAREILRFLLIDEDFNTWKLSTNEANFYNLFFAFISLILGQSICFIYWFNRNRGKLQKHRLYKSVVNDQQFLNFSFVFWFAKIGAVFAFLFSSLGGFDVDSIYPHYRYIFILIIIVLFLQTWVSIRRVFRNSLKYLLLTALIISVLSFGLSKINIIDYRIINNYVASKNIHIKYNLTLPKMESDLWFKKHYFYAYELIHIIINHKSEVYLNKIDYDDNYAYETGLKFAYLYIDKAANYRVVDSVKNLLLDNNIRRIAYAAKRKNDNNQMVVFFQHRLNFKSSESPALSDFPDLYPIEISNSSINIKELIKEGIKNHPEYVVNYSFNLDIDFGSYFYVRETVYNTIYEIREEYSLARYSIPFDDLDEDTQMKIRDLYPISLKENIIQ